MVWGVKGAGRSFAQLVSVIWLLNWEDSGEKGGRGKGVKGFFIINWMQTIVITKLCFHDDWCAHLEGIKRSNIFRLYVWFS